MADFPHSSLLVSSWLLPWRRAIGSGLCSSLVAWCGVVDVVYEYGQVSYVVVVYVYVVMVLVAAVVVSGGSMVVVGVVVR